ncbi:DNAse [Lactococcus lactis subsp. lactis]|uniref:DNA/RNA non-specific endonuclease n=1 Tax=Lactococcus lactis TaxID=1358 RepID=UPI00223BD180|nr:DNA/RNA non-specific endonuclease [Lactococcus lactis]MCT0017680.1 DNAse [Lactococcus lactis subsp. lactis]
MKREQKGCLGGLISWVGRVLFSLVFAIGCLWLIYSWSYQHVKPFKQFADKYQVLQTLKGNSPNINVQLPNQRESQQNETVSDVLTFKKLKQLELGKLDVLGRATYAHIQLNNSDEPTQKRESRLKYNPPGWHNYHLEVQPGKKSWVMNRGHLVGYQFSGLNDEPKNLVCETAWFNQGDYASMNDSNPQSMLYYENRLDQWLSKNPNAYLDYKVTPIYRGSELIPRQIKLNYIGLNESGQPIIISLGSDLEHSVNGKTEVVLNNFAPKLDINYQNGTVTLK